MCQKYKFFRAEGVALDIPKEQQVEQALRVHRSRMEFGKPDAATVMYALQRLQPKPYLPRGNARYCPTCNSELDGSPCCRNCGQKISYSKRSVNVYMAIQPCETTA